MPVFLFFVVGAALAVSSIASKMMTIVVNENPQAGHRLSWWGRDTSEVYIQYRERYPQSPLPVIARYSFRFCMVMVTVFLVYELFAD
jgi:hypothetical protein